MTSKVLGIATMATVVSVVLLLVGIWILMLLHVCLVGRAFRRRYGERVGKCNGGMSNTDLEMLPCFKFEAGEKGGNPVDCAVCLENFKMGDKCRKLPVCKHSFHVHCVDYWLRRTPICPICRTTAVSCEGVVDSEMGCSPVDGAGFELRESQSAGVGFPVSSNPSPLHGSSLE